MITNRDEGKGKPPRLFPKTGYLSGYPEPALQQKTEERERERDEICRLTTTNAAVSQLFLRPRVDDTATINASQ